MITGEKHIRPSQKRAPSLASAFLLTLVTLSVAQAAPPLEPLPAPVFSFSRDSPGVLKDIVVADGILVLGHPHPLTRVSGALLGLGAAEDELDALSGANARFVGYSEDHFALLFSVDAESIGALPPDPELVAEGVPYNVLDQAVRGQQAGDQFMSTKQFELSEIGEPDDPGGEGNNVLIRNNYDEGGIDFSAQPPTSAEDVVEGVPQDRVDAIAYLAPSEGNLFSEPVYFSASAGSPSLAGLPGSSAPSGAHVFFYSPMAGSTTLYASFAQFGLQQDDDIDALIVFDTNADGRFNGSDRILFSLTPGSPSLATISGASATGAAADVFASAPDEPPWLFVPASKLGLGHAEDNVDALDLVLCDDESDDGTCAVAHGIRRISGEAGQSKLGH